MTSTDPNDYRARENQPFFYMAHYNDYDQNVPLATTKKAINDYKGMFIFMEIEYIGIYSSISSNNDY